jgi:hypothetical protein
MKKGRWQSNPIENGLLLSMRRHKNNFYIHLSLIREIDNPNRGG